MKKHPPSIPWKTVLEDLKREDPDFAAEWERRKPYRDVALEIYRIRSEAGLTQAQLAEKIGTSRSVISRIESLDYGRISYNMLVRIAEALGLEIEIRFKKVS